MRSAAKVLKEGNKRRQQMSEDPEARLFFVRQGVRVRVAPASCRQVWLQAQNEGEDNFTEAMCLAGLPKLVCPVPEKTCSWAQHAVPAYYMLFLGAHELGKFAAEVGDTTNKKKKKKEKKKENNKNKKKKNTKKKKNKKKQKTAHKHFAGL